MWQVGAGEIAAMFGVDCATGTTFTKPGLEPKLSLMNMHVPHPVISLAIKPKDKAGGLSNFSKVLVCYLPAVGLLSALCSFLSAAIKPKDDPEELSYCS